MHTYGLAVLSESNLGETTSARLYFCTEEPTWKVISLSVPPMNLPLNQGAILQFQRIGPRKGHPQPQGNDQSGIQHYVGFCSAAFLFPSSGSCRLDSWGSQDRTQLVLLGHLSSFPFGDRVGLLRQG